MTDSTFPSSPKDSVAKTGPTLSWSLSAVGTYEKCAAKARYKYVEKLGETRAEAASRGVAFHKDIELFLTGAAPSLPESLSYYQGWLEQVKTYEIYPEHIIKLNENWEVTKEGDPYWYKGVLDLKVLRRHTSIESDEIVIYDWKTGKIYPDHDDQKTLYSIAAFSEHPTVLSVRAIHVYLDLRQIREKTYHRDQMHHLREHWTSRAGKYLKALRDPEGMIPHPGFHCRYCSFSRAKGGPCRF